MRSQRPSGQDGESKPGGRLERAAAGSDCHLLGHPTPLADSGTWRITLFALVSQHLRLDSGSREFTHTRY
jgi:hypothetical protein